MLDRFYKIIEIDKIHPAILNDLVYPAQHTVICNGPMT